MYDVLIGIFEGKTNADILDQYAEIRWKTFVDTFNPTADPVNARSRHPFLSALRNATPDEPQRIPANQTLHIDMSQHFGKPGDMNGIPT